MSHNMGWIVQAKDVVWRTVQYDDQKQDLLVSDLDRLRAKEKERLQEPLKGEPWDVGGESFPSDTGILSVVDPDPH
jgi:hypothetical protein